MTTITVEREAFVAALAVAGSVPPWAPPWSVSTNTAPLGLVRIEATDGFATITSANPDRSISKRVAVDGLRLGITVPFVALSGWAQKAPTGARIEITDNGPSVTLVAGRARATLPTFEKPLYPARDPRGAVATARADLLRAGLEAVVSVPKDDLVKPYLGAVLLHGSGEQLGFIATDSSRIHEITSAGGSDVRAVLPNGTARLLLAVLPNGTEPVGITIDERSIAFDFDGTRVASPLIDSAYPATAQEFAAPMPNTLRARADHLLADIEMVATVADSREREFRLSLGATSFAAARAQNGDKGQVELLAQWEGRPFDITFALRPVRDALALFGEEMIEWSMGAPLEPTAITSGRRGDVRALVAPFIPKIQEQRIAA
ncbi:hypothetical protein [Sphingomonas sp. GC_Shp_3]|uniref:DNA polymerase III subunit beta family protein n=1 Tax=Sphingomonas sp. GC_Shp_3 TaxID=2937383 RepID=UPI00226A1092|nr:hypothetical protein [Sphingomonas sp. GC_Shp_3]